MASSDELGKDLDHVLVLIKKFDEFMKDLMTSEGRMVKVGEMAQGLLDEGHTESDVIQSQVEVSSNDSKQPVVECATVLNRSRVCHCAQP